MPVDPRIQAALDAPLSGGPSSKSFELQKTIDGKKIQRRGGYGGIPGSGPDGETCGSCSWLRTSDCSLRTYYKCGMIAPTRGSATDIRKRSAACNKWIKRP